MSLLQSIGAVKDRPMIATIAGEQGSGKTCLAATFPNPIFIRVEDGLQSVPKRVRPDAFPALRGDVDLLFAQLDALIKEDHEYETIVIDTVTSLEQMFIKHVLDNDTSKKKVQNINQACGGYGAGPNAVASLHQKVLAKGEELNHQGMHVLFLAHTDLETMDMPNAEPYTRYSLRMGKKSLPAYLDFVDNVALCSLDARVIPATDDKKSRTVTTGGRIINCVYSLSTVAKNRYNITEEIPFELGKNPFEFLNIFSKEEE